MDLDLIHCKVIDFQYRLKVKIVILGQAMWSVYFSLLTADHSFDLFLEQHYMASESHPTQWLPGSIPIPYRVQATHTNDYYQTG